MMPFPQNYVFSFNYINLLTEEEEIKMIYSKDFKMYSMHYGLWFKHKSNKYGIRVNYEENDISLIDLTAPYGKEKKYIIGALCRK
jgi:hypothetical protein